MIGLLKMNSYLDQNSSFNLDLEGKSEWFGVLKQKIAKNKSVIEVCTAQIKVL